MEATIFCPNGDILRIDFEGWDNRDREDFRIRLIDFFGEIRREPVAVFFSDECWMCKRKRHECACPR